jgi:hypothetical protein
MPVGFDNQAAGSSSSTAEPQVLLAVVAREHANQSVNNIGGFEGSTH